MVPPTVSVTPPTVPVTASNGPDEGASLTKTSYSSTPATIPLAASAAPLRTPETAPLGGPQGLLALPEGHAEHLAALPISQGDEPFEPLHLLELGQGLLLGVALGVVHPVRRTLYGGHPCVHAAPPSSRLDPGGLALSTA